MKKEQLEEERVQFKKMTENQSFQSNQWVNNQEHKLKRVKHSKTCKKICN
jgi:hypothetical protein